MKYTTILFDMDGTIVNTEVLWVEATRLLLTRRGIDVTPTLQKQINLRVRGLHVNAICAELKHMFDLQDDVATLAQEEEGLVHSLYDSRLDYMEGFKEFHAQLEKLNIKCAIATNATDISLAKTNDILNLDRFFGPHIYGSTRVHGVTKPAPDIFLYAAKQLNSNPAECIVIEDSPHGITAAKAARMYCIGVNNTGIPEFTQHANAVIKNFTELDAHTLLYGQFEQSSQIEELQP